MLASVLLWLLLALALWRPLTRRTANRRWPTLFALLSAALIGVVTLTPDGWFRLRDPRACLDVTPSELRFAATNLFAGSPEFFNVLLFLPLGYFLVLASGKVPAAAVTVLVLPALAEVAQAAFVQRVCAALDWFDNSLGGLVGVAAGAVVIAARPGGRGRVDRNTVQPDEAR